PAGVHEGLQPASVSGVALVGALPTPPLPVGVVGAPPVPATDDDIPALGVTGGVPAAALPPASMPARFNKPPKPPLALPAAPPMLGIIMAPPMPPPPPAPPMPLVVCMML